MSSRSDESQQEEDLYVEKRLLGNSINTVLSIFKEFIEQEKNNQNSEFFYINDLFGKMVKEKTQNQKNSKKKEQNPFNKKDLIKLLENDQHRALFQVAFEKLLDSEFYKKEIQNNKKLGARSIKQYLEKIPLVWKQELAKKKDFSFWNFSSDENAKKIQLNEAEMNEIAQMKSVNIQLQQLQTKKEYKKKHNRNIQKIQVIKNQVQEPATQKKQKVEKTPQNSFVSPLDVSEIFMNLEPQPIRKPSFELEQQGSYKESRS